MNEKCLVEKKNIIDLKKKKKKQRVLIPKSVEWEFSWSFCTCFGLLEKAGKEFTPSFIVCKVPKEYVSVYVKNFVQIIGRNKCEGRQKLQN